MATKKGHTQNSGWVQWPLADETMAAHLIEVLYSGRWAISGDSVGRISYNEMFEQAFADYHHVPFCITCSSGSSALVIALEALEIKHGDEVLVPALTWVACASAVCRVGAIPVFIDLDEATGCMSLDKAAAYISSKTKAILLVHSYCSIADIDGFLKLSQQVGIPIIEDCSQAHGAEYQHRKVGTFGAIGVFSFQQSKVLTCGEGGAAITSDKEIAERLYQLRADGRMFHPNHQKGGCELLEIPTVQGYNYCLSEFHAAILLCGIKKLEKENALRTKNGLAVKKALESAQKQVKVVYRSDDHYKPTIYKYCIRVASPTSARNDEVIDLIIEKAKRFDLSIKRVHPPIYRSPLYIPSTSNRQDNAYYEELKDFRVSCSHSELFYSSVFCLPHYYLLGNEHQTEFLIQHLITLLEESLP